MNEESAPSKKEASPPDNARVDGSLGFVPATEIRNVWMEAISKLDQPLWPVRGPIPPRDVILEFLQDLQFKLLTRASSNLEKILGKAGVNVRPKVDEAEVAPSKSAQAVREARMAK